MILVKERTTGKTNNSRSWPQVIVKVIFPQMLPMQEHVGMIWGQGAM